MTKFLDNMKFPEDIKVLNNSELEILGEEIREFLIKSVSKTGGHLASNLGVVELTLSLFKSLNLEKDKIIWDVGHQSYVHKILTGRKDGFVKLRQKDGLSGFPKRCESVYDAFDTGHSSTSISAALGMARARDIQKEDYKVVAVIGDGALTGGMAFEALNDVGFNKTNMIIILNDNQMSISKNVGGMSSYLNKLRIEPKYNKFKTDINSTFKDSTVGKAVIQSLSRVKDSVKQLIVPSMLFEDMGIKYIGPVDGHNIPLLVELINKVKNIDGPVIIHTITKKGKGYDFAERSPWKYHGISPFDLESGEPRISPTNSYSKAFGNALMDLAKDDPKVVAITAAMPDGTGLRCFAKEFPKRFFDVGIAEQHAVTLAAGMAATGLKPVFAVYSTFLQRAFDQVVHDVCIQNLPVVFAIDRAGVVGDDGETHQGIMDISYLSMIPNITIVAPKSIEEVKPLLSWAFKHNGPVAIRYPRGGDTEEIKALTTIEYGKWEKVSQGEKVAVIATGKMVSNALKAKKLLKSEGIDPLIINATFIKPIDKELIKELSKEGYDIITVEDNLINGGLGTMILNELVSCDYRGQCIQLGYDDKFVNQGDVEILYKDNNLHAEGIKESVMKLWQKRKND